MSLAAGTRLGPYEVLEPLGAGGMGEVYRARDTKLERDVALKVVPDVFAGHADRLARFEREAKTLAALNHPHIAHVHGLEESPAISPTDRRPDTPRRLVRAIVMEMVEGQTLAQRIARGPVPVDEALPIARQLADALEYAHERGVVHRDLKPANVKLTPDGVVKVLDFGLAKALESGPTSTESADAQAVTSPAMTRAGVVLGTAAYMSPEQARGRTIDKRVDIWAFGCVLFEMLTAHRAFPGEDMTDTIVAVVTAEPDWNALPASTPARVRELLARCLAKDPKQRLHDIADARLEIDQAMRPGGTSTSTAAIHATPVAPHARSRAWRAVPWALAAIATLVAAVAISDPRRRAEAPVGVMTSFSVDLPDGLQLTATPPALSPDGRRLAFSALGGSGIAIYTRDLDSFDVRQVAGSEGGLSPFFSPDGRWLGFHTGSLVKKVPVGGGQASTLARLPFWVDAATWTADGQIVVSGLTGGLWATPSEPGRDGELVEVTRIDQTRGERVHQHPVALPDGRLLFTIVRDGDNLVGVYDPGAKRAYPLGASGEPVAHLPSGHLVFQQAGRLVAAPFDLAGTKLSQSATPVLPEAVPDQVAFSGTGLVAYLHHPQGMRRTLVRVDRRGTHERLLSEAGNYRWPRVSPDGRRLAVGTGRNISVIDLQNGSRIQLQDEGINTEPVWTPDGRRLIYSSYRGSSADADLYWQPADGSGTSELLSSLPFDQWPTAVSPDGRVLAFYGQPKGQAYGIWTVTLDQAHTATQVVSSTGFVRGARFSPDGKWLAYSSDETGRFEVYVRPFPSLDAKWSVSSEGGNSPTWSPDGRELFYRSGSRVMVADVIATPTFSARPPRVLSEGPFDVDISGDIDYDVTPDGQHFVMMLVERSAQPRLRVLSGWTPTVSRR